MEILIWIGAGLAVFGIAGVIYSMIRVARAKNDKMTDEELRDTIRKVIPINLGTLFVAMIGLMMVVIGVMFG